MDLTRDTLGTARRRLWLMPLGNRERTIVCWKEGRKRILVILRRIEWGGSLSAHQETLVHILGELRQIIFCFLPKIKNLGLEDGKQIRCRVVLDSTFFILNGFPFFLWWKGFSPTCVAKRTFQLMFTVSLSIQSRLLLLLSPILKLYLSWHTRVVLKN